MTTRIDNYFGKFKDQRWLVAHNAWNTEIVPNQCKTITELLDYGVRGLAFDIYGDNESALHLQHGHGNDASSTNWKQIREELDAWLRKNDEQIVTLFFESYLTGPKAFQKSPTALGALDTSLRRVTGYKSGSSVQKGAIKGKTLKELVADNHRLFAFIERKPDEGSQNLFPTMTTSFAENVYGDESLKIPTWVKLRAGSGRNRIRPLAFMNHFGNAPSGSEWARNEPGLIQKHADDFMFAFGGRYPNFISLDYINWDARRGPMKAINALMQRKDFTAVTRFHWSGSNDFDDVVFSIDDSKKIVGFTVGTEKGKGIVKINPKRDSQGERVTDIELVNVPGQGVVDMRYMRAGQWSSWLAGAAGSSNATSPNLAKHHIRGNLYGICCRTQKGYGVTDFAAAYR